MHILNPGFLYFSAYWKNIFQKLCVRSFIYNVLQKQQTVYQSSYKAGELNVQAEYRSWKVNYCGDKGETTQLSGQWQLNRGLWPRKGMPHIGSDIQVRAPNGILASGWVRKHVQCTAIIDEEMSQYFHTALYFSETPTV